jgi:excisionase family DNA binding protein
MDSKALTLIEAAALARVHPVSLRRAIRRGELRHFRVLNRIRIHREELERFLFGAYPQERRERKPDA